MSLPGKAIFYKDDSVVFESFVNCGCSDDEEKVQRCVYDLYREGTMPSWSAWDVVKLYGRTYGNKFVANLTKALLAKRILKDVIERGYRNEIVKIHFNKYMITHITKDEI